jgi:hypothetical protein
MPETRTTVQGWGDDDAPKITLDFKHGTADPVFNLRIKFPAASTVQVSDHEGKYTSEHFEQGGQVWIAMVGAEERDDLISALLDLANDLEQVDM